MMPGVLTIQVVARLFVTWAFIDTNSEKANFYIAVTRPPHLAIEASSREQNTNCLQPGRGRRPHCLRLTWRMYRSRHRVAYDVNAKSMADFRQVWPVSCLSCLAPGPLASSAPWEDALA
jgi:hypothetical protein